MVYGLINNVRDLENKDLTNKLRSMKFEIASKTYNGALFWNHLKTKFDDYYDQNNPKDTIFWQETFLENVLGHVSVSADDCFIRGDVFPFQEYDYYVTKLLDFIETKH